ncbi:hypothetical protein BGZ80_001170 [Entomortierella chlamydospora]|uniref:Uncharacterized protein n=1 Tax=Entomortierella chlamydospora TaxID=101097 RepID=A0A9P6MR62_9FUNG|nr:hypothetical protein BGZ79_009472 [Entomortierella chlamydospora]KAG0010809.1 hypothetical protein BGZ80_001170 [Entomortierella chlamydospora]
MDGCKSLEAGRSDNVLHVDQPSSQGSPQASVKQSCNDVSTEGVIEALSVKEVNTASSMDKDKCSSTSELENASSTIGMVVENDGSQQGSLRVSLPETSGSKLEDVALTTLQLAISTSPSGIPLSSPSLLVVQPTNNDQISGVGPQHNIPPSSEADTQYPIQLLSNPTVSCEQLECQQQATLNSNYKEKVDQSTNDRCHDDNDGDESIVGSVPINKRALPSRRSGGEDEGGERETITVLENELTSDNSNSKNQSRLKSTHEIAADINEASEADRRSNLHRTRFMLETSGLELDEGTNLRSGSVSPTDFSLPSSSEPSASSSSADSPVSNRTRQRPYSHFHRRSILRDPEPSELPVFHPSQFQQHHQLRRSLSLPSSPCSPVSSYSVAQQEQLLHQQLRSGTPLTFARGRSESRKSVMNNEIHERELQEEEGGRESESNKGAKVTSGRNSQRLSSSPMQSSSEPDEESSTEPLATTISTTTTSSTTTSTTSLARAQGPQIQLLRERPRRLSLLSPRQFEMIIRQNENSNSSPLGGGGGTNGKKGGLSGFLKDHAKRNKKKSTADPPQPIPNASDSSQKQKKVWPQKKQQRHSARDMPVISFQPHSTDISTDRPSVSGRLVLHIPRLPGLKFHFVSLALHLRLKESISWARQDLVSFEIERRHWSQIVWDKRMMLPFQDRQVEEGGDAGYVAGIGRHLSPAAAVAAAVSASASTSGNDSMDSNASSVSLHGGILAASSSSMKSENHGDKFVHVPMDEWRWEWLLPVSTNEVRPESFEGSMGFIWYELEAKCRFRWDKVDKDGQVIRSDEVQSFNSQATLDGTSTPPRGLGSNKLLKGLGVSTNKSIAQVFEKLRPGNKSKKPQRAGDFKLNNATHEEFIRNSRKKSNENLAAAAAAQLRVTPINEPGENLEATADYPLDGAETEDGIAPYFDSKPLPPLPNPPADPVPFLIRKTLKLYFNKPPSRASSNPAFFLPSPSMSLPNLPRTRRLKAIIPGAKIQVQIQVPSVITIPGYAHSSRLVPCSRTGGLIEVRRGSNADIQAKDDDGGEKTVYSFVGKKNKNRPATQPTQGQQRHQEDTGQCPNTFQAALTIRKVTKQDINSDDMLRRRYENAQLAADAINSSLAHQVASGRASPRPGARKRLLSCSNQSIGGSEQGDSVNNDSHRYLDNRPWRKEVHVRKVKCEFWQKEICRIPVGNVPSRSTRIPLGPCFTYSEKEQDKERKSSIPRPQHHQHTDTNNPVMSEDPLLMLPPPPRFGGIGMARKDSTSSIASSTLQQYSMVQPQTPSSQPFTLLIPVPLDSSSLRQTFAWPSSETPSPIAPPGCDRTTPRGMNGSFGLESLGAGSELDYPSESTVNETGSSIGNEVETTVRGLNGGVNNGSPVKARIEVQHYLAFRLSLDVLEFEGEYDRQDGDEFDMGMGGYEEYSIYNSGDDSFMGITPPSSSSGLTGVPYTPSSTSFPAALSNQASSSTSPTNGSRYGTGLSSSASTIEPALNFLNSAAGLLDMDSTCDPGPIGYPAAFALKYDLSKRRGSEASRGTYRSNQSAYGYGSGAGSFNQQTLNYSSDSGMTPHTLTPNGSGSGGSGGGLISGAIGALKKKASGSALGGGNHQQQTRNGRNVSVQRLKDFLIRVPVTVAIQADERGQVTSAHGRINKGESTGGEEANNKAFPSDGVHGTRRSVTTTETTTTTNIVTGSSEPMGSMYDFMDGTDSFSSVNSMTASTGSEPVMKRMMDDFTTTSSLAPMFAGMKHRRNRGGDASPSSTFASHYNSLQYQQQQQQQRHHNSSQTGGYVISGLRYLNSSSDGDGRKEIDDDEDEEEGDFVVVDAEEMAEDDIDGDSPARVPKTVEKMRQL